MLSGSTYQPNVGSPHPDPSVDCALLPGVPPSGSGAYWSGWVLDDGTATTEVMSREGMGIGDEVFAVGLFRNYLGEDRNEPILRAGISRPCRAIRSLAAITARCERS